MSRPGSAASARKPRIDERAGRSRRATITISRMLNRICQATSYHPLVHIKRPLRDTENRSSTRWQVISEFTRWP